MHYVNEHIIKTFEYLFNLRCKYDSIDKLITSSRKSRTLYRINQEKLDKYRSQYNSRYDNEYFVSNENKNLYIEEKKIKPKTEILSEKVINQKTISTQTTFSQEIDSSTDLIHQSVDILSVIPKIISNHHNEDTLNTFSSSSEIIELKRNNNSNISTNLSSVSSSSSSSNTKKTTTLNSNSLDLSNKSISEILMKTDSNQINKYKFKPQSTNCHVYIRSIVRHMLSDDTSDEEQC